MHLSKFQGISLLTFIISFFPIASQAGFLFDSQAEKNAKAIAESINKNAPAAITQAQSNSNGLGELIDISATVNKTTVTMRYVIRTRIGYNQDDVALLKQDSISATCRNKGALQSGVSIRFVYVSQSGQDITTFLTDRSICGY
jgi:hypothetical protein